ncbi:MAG: hypothetical protein AAF479_12865 [Pseudomonadota bacterium]
MASWSDEIRKARNLTSCATVALILSGGAAFSQEFPGDLWSVSYVKVSGANTDAVRRGLSDAANRVFYGDDVETHLRANARDDGTFDLSIIGPGGKELASRSGLSYDPTGNVANSVTQAALSWMGGLSCGDGCQVAVSVPAPAPAPATPKADVALAAAEAIQKAEEQAATNAEEAPKAEAAAQAEEVKEPIVLAAVQPEVEAPVVKAPAAPAASAAVTVPKAAVETKKPEGLDADLFLRKPKAAPAPKAGDSRPKKPASTAAVKAPKLPTARTVVRPSVAAAPSTDSGSTVPKTEAPSASAPAIAAKPEPAKVPEVKVATPSAGTSPTPEVPRTAEVEAPAVAAVDPVVAPEAPKPEAVEAPKPEVAEVPKPAPVVAEQPVETDESVAVIQPSAAETQEVSPAVSVPAPQDVDTPTVSEIAETTAAAAAAAATGAAAGASEDGDGEQLALINPQAEVTPTPAATPEPTEPLQPAAAVDTPAEASQPAEETDTTVETRIAAVDPTAEGPTLANARWVGFTPAVFTGSDNKAGAWIAGPFDRKQRTGWITDTATGATTRVTFIWREGGSGSRTALLSREAAKELGLGQGDVANVAVYLPR